MSLEKTQKITMVSVSILAVMMSAPRPASSQQINCPQRLYIGNDIACDNGTLRINPDGSTNIVGCLITNTAPQPARCQLWTVGTPTRNVVVSFGTTSINPNAGANTVTVDTFRMQENGQPTVATQLTFTPAEVMATVQIDIGGTVHFSDGQPAGVYSGDLQIHAVFD